MVPSGWGYASGQPCPAVGALCVVRRARGGRSPPCPGVWGSRNRAAGTLREGGHFGSPRCLVVGTSKLPERGRVTAFPTSVGKDGRCRRNTELLQDGERQREAEVQGPGRDDRVRQRAAPKPRALAVPGPRPSQGPLCRPPARARAQPRVRAAIAASGDGGRHMTESKRALPTAGRGGATGLPASGRPGSQSLPRSPGLDCAGRFIHRL
jgi:hypothetical protein